MLGPGRVNRALYAFSLGSEDESTLRMGSEYFFEDKGPRRMGSEPFFVSEWLVFAINA